MNVWKIRLTHKDGKVEHVTGCNVIPKTTKTGKIFTSEAIVTRMYNEVITCTDYKFSEYKVAIVKFELTEIEVVKESDNEG